MVGSKLSMLKYFRCFHHLASLLVGAGDPRVSGILWVGVGETKPHRGGRTRHAACKCAWATEMQLLIYFLKGTDPKHPLSARPGLSSEKDLPV